MKRLVLMSVIALFLCVGCAVKPNGVDRSEGFNKPDIKNEFCGVVINFQYCKCAFHGQFCKEIGMSRKEAGKYVDEQYENWFKDERTEFTKNCVAANGYVKDDTCNYCDVGYGVRDGACVSGAATEVGVKLPDGPYNDDCTLVQEEFDRDWKKYSDIDNAIPYEDRSYEAKQALTVYESMVSMMVEGFALERDIEIEKQMQSELQVYRIALTNNIKSNLLKSFWRLAWVTYSTVDSIKGLKGSYEKLLDLESYAEGISASLKIIRSGVPSESSLAIDTSTISGKAKSAGASVALDAVESLGDPTTIATTIFQEATNATLPSADITDEEVAILRQQHERKGLIDQVLRESASANAAREERMRVLERGIAELQLRVDGWEGKEKERVATSLVESCQKLVNKHPRTDGEDVE